jgi:hypothetical protein
MEKEELAALDKSSFELDCLQMMLTRCDGSKKHSGAGYIRQSEDGGFDFRLFAPEQLDLRNLSQGRDTQAGQLIHENHMWKLDAVDTQGRTWTAERIWDVGVGGHVDKPGFVVGGKFLDLTSQSDERHKSKIVSIEMLTFQKFKFPRNQHSTTTQVLGKNQPRQSFKFNVAEFVACGFSFSIHDDGELIRFTATSETTTLSPYFERRVNEALLFALGIDISWSVTERHEDSITKTKISASNPAESLFPRPPIACRFANTEGIWELFELYLRFIIEKDGFEFHPLTAQLHAIYSSRKSSMQIQALASSFAVESILTQFFRDEGRCSEEQTHEIDAAIQHMQKWDDGSMKTRACEILGNLKKSRAIDKLYALAARNAVNELNVEVWKKLRDSVAHGHWADDFQSLVDDVGSALVLLYQLVFHLIGYNGKQTDWGTHGWPLIDYPPNSRPSSK